MQSEYRFLDGTDVASRGGRILVPKHERPSIPQETNRRPRTARAVS